MRYPISGLALCAALPAAAVLADTGQLQSDPVGFATALPGRAAPPSHLAAFRPLMPPSEFGSPDPRAVVAALSVQETESGIRTDQFEAWRNFTEALLAVMRPPKPPVHSAGAFGIAATIGSDLADKGREAEALTVAIGRLRSTLTPDQLERAKRAELAGRTEIRHLGTPGGLGRPAPPDEAQATLPGMRGPTH